MPKDLFFVGYSILNIDIATATYCFCPASTTSTTFLHPSRLELTTQPGEHIAHSSSSNNPLSAYFPVICARSRPSPISNHSTSLPFRQTICNRERKKKREKGNSRLSQRLIFLTFQCWRRIPPRALEISNNAEAVPPVSVGARINCAPPSLPSPPYQREPGA